VMAIWLRVEVSQQAVVARRQRLVEVQPE
jgi:hypothetical protein